MKNYNLAAQLAMFVRSFEYFEYFYSFNMSITLLSIATETLTFCTCSIMTILGTNVLCHNPNNNYLIVVVVMAYLNHEDIFYCFSYYQSHN